VYVGNRPTELTDPQGLMDWPDSLNGNVIPGHDPDQDMECSNPAQVLGRCERYRDCCREHDQCYQRFHCNASSWFTTGWLPLPCGTCNLLAVGCILSPL